MFYLRKWIIKWAVELCIRSFFFGRPTYLSCRYFFSLANRMREGLLQRYTWRYSICSTRLQFQVVLQWPMMLFQPTTFSDQQFIFTVFKLMPSASKYRFIVVIILYLLKQVNEFGTPWKFDTKFTLFTRDIALSLHEEMLAALLLLSLLLRWQRTASIWYHVICYVKRTNRKLPFYFHCNSITT